MDGNVEDRRATVSLFNGPLVTIKIVDTFAEETELVGEWLRARTSEGVQPHEVAVFVRSSAELDRAKAAAKHAELSLKVLDDDVETAIGKISIGTMHLAKGLEFRAVAVVACDDEVILLQERIEQSRMMQIWKMFITLNANCSTSPVPERGSIYC